MPTPSLSHCKH